MKIRVDRKIPVPVSLQIKGQIEYGVVYGTMKSGQRLPNVRDLARELQVSPMTVSQAYRALKDAGIVESAPGRGTYIANAVDSQTEKRRELGDLQRQAHELVMLAEQLEVSREGLFDLLDKIIRNQAEASPLQLGFVGIHREASELYAHEIARYLPARDSLQVFILSDFLEAGDALNQRLARISALLTFAHRRDELAKLAQLNRPVIPVKLLPSAGTRQALAGLEPLTRVALTAASHEFLAVMNLGIGTYAPHLVVREAVLVPEHVGRLEHGEIDVLVKATGSDLSGLSRDLDVIEYVHMPDPVHLHSTVLPRLMTLRH